MAKQAVIILEVMIIMLINKNTRFKYCSTKKFYSTKKYTFLLDQIYRLLDQKYNVYTRINAI